MTPQSPAALLALSPCPGCGGTDTRVIGGPNTRGGPKYWAGCDHCRWRTWGDTEADAIATWNHREPDPAYWQLQHSTLLTAYNELLAAKGGGEGAALNEEYTRGRIDGWEAASPAKSGWLPIESAPVGREMFVVRAFNVSNGFTGGKPYTTDPWCVWQDNYGDFQRWPHNFPPTHWFALTTTPESN